MGMPLPCQTEDVHWSQRSIPAATYIVYTTKFELVVAVAVIIKFAIAGLAIQYEGLETGYILNFPGCTWKAEDVWPFWLALFNLFSGAFMIFFFFELILRVSAAGLYIAALSVWLWLDLMLLVLDIFDLVSIASEFSPTSFRLLRVFRVVRMVKIIRLLKKCDGLFVFVRSLQASLPFLVWSFFSAFTYPGFLRYLDCANIRVFLL